MMTLLDLREADVVIAEEISKVAAANGDNGKEGNHAVAQPSGRRLGEMR
jgi:hypothetical protein